MLSSSELEELLLEDEDLEEDFVLFEEALDLDDFFEEDLVVELPVVLLFDEALDLEFEAVWVSPLVLDLPETFDPEDFELLLPLELLSDLEELPFSTVEETELSAVLVSALPVLSPLLAHPQDAIKATITAVTPKK